MANANTPKRLRNALGKQVKLGSPEERSDTVANTLKVANMAGALRAGVTSLNDASEVREFCIRVDSAGETPVVPQRYRQSIHDEDLLTFFQRLSKAQGWEANEGITLQIIESLKKK